MVNGQNAKKSWSKFWPCVHSHDYRVYGDTPYQRNHIICSGDDISRILSKLMSCLHFLVVATRIIGGCNFWCGYQCFDMAEAGLSYSKFGTILMAHLSLIMAHISMALTITFFIHFGWFMFHFWHICVLSDLYGLLSNWLKQFSCHFLNFYKKKNGLKQFCVILA